MAARNPTHPLPDTLAVAKKAKVVGTLGVVLGLSLDQGVARPKCVVSVPDGLNKGITSPRETNSDVKADLGRRSHFQLL